MRLIWTLEVAGDRGPPERSRDQGLDVFRRQPDGRWRIARFTAYPLPPLPRRTGEAG